MEYTLLEQYFFIEGRSVVNVPLNDEEMIRNTLNSSSAPFYFYDHRKNPLSLFLGMWWAFRKSLMVSLFAIQCANIGALIYLLRDSVEITSRARKYRKNGREKDIVSAVTFAGWNCVYECRCPPGDYGKTFCPREKGCHRIWDPMTVSFILLAASLWFAEVVGLVILLILSIRRERRAFMSVLNPLGASSRSSTRGDEKNTTYLPSMSYDAAAQEGEAQNSHSDHDAPLSASLKFLIYLTGLFIVSTSPIMTVAVVDALSKEYLLFGSINLFVGAMNFLYCSVSPFMLVYYMPDLKLMVASMLAR